jgi:hypothetical protein
MFPIKVYVKLRASKEAKKMKKAIKEIIVEVYSSSGEQVDHYVDLELTSAARNSEVNFEPMLFPMGESFIHVYPVTE